MKLIAAYQKNRAIAYTSHLDVQRTLQRAFRRADLPLAYSNGFNPHPLMSFATALKTGYTSACEWFALELVSPVAPDAFLARVNAVLPMGMQVSDAFVGDDAEILSRAVRASRYRVEVHFDAPVERETLQSALSTLLSGTEILINKRTKSGMRQADIRPQILKAALTEASGSLAVFDLVGTLTVDGGLPVDSFFQALFDRMDSSGVLLVHRARMYFDGIAGLPCLSESERKL